MSNIAGVVGRNVMEKKKALFFPLPPEIAVEFEEGEGLCELRDQYVEYSKTWSPEGYEDFHASCFWGMASLVAGRRMRLNEGNHTPPLLVMLAARSTVFAKSTTAVVQWRILQAAGFEWMMEDRWALFSETLSGGIGRDIRAMKNALVGSIGTITPSSLRAMVGKRKKNLV